MRALTIRRPDGGAVVARAGLADGWWRRLRGLLGREGLAEGEGLLLVPCRSVHMWGMRFAIDVAFLTRAGEVVAVYPGLRPGARTGWHRDAWAALEVAEGVLGRHEVGVGTRLALEEAA